MDAALGLGGPVFVDQVLEATTALTAVCEPDLVVDLLGAVHVAETGEANVVKRVVRNVVLT